MRPDCSNSTPVTSTAIPNASSFYDGVPDASVAINIGRQLHLLIPWRPTLEPTSGIATSLPRTPSVGMVRTNLCPSASESSSRRHGLCWPPLFTTQQGNLAHVYQSTIRISCALIRYRSDTGARVAASMPINDGDWHHCTCVEYPSRFTGSIPDFHFVGITFKS